MAWRISLSRFADEARTMILARDGSSRVLPICMSWRSNVPPIIRIVSSTFARINESMIWPWSKTVSLSCVINQTPTRDGYAPHKFYHQINTRRSDLDCVSQTHRALNHLRDVQHSLQAAQNDPLA